MNSGFNERQIKAYATAFEVGDAIWCNGEWHEAVENEVNGDSRLTAHVDGNIYVINDGQSGNHYAFKVMERSENPCRATTLQDYELQGGEKVIPTSKFMDNIEFGKPYHVKLDSYGTPIVTDDNGNDFVPDGGNWAVIPRYEQVQSIEQKEVEASDIANILYKRYYDYLHNILRVDIESALNKNDYQKVVELSGLMIEMEESK